jgi:hypothetical protein
MSFKPGHAKIGGRKAGQPNKNTRDVKDWSRSIVEDPKGLTRTRQDYQRGRLSPAIFIELMNRAFGKPKERTDLHVTGEVRQTQVILSEEK